MKTIKKITVVFCVIAFFIIFSNLLFIQQQPAKFNTQVRTHLTVEDLETGGYRRKMDTKSSSFVPENVLNDTSNIVQDERKYLDLDPGDLNMEQHADRESSSQENQDYSSHLKVSKDPTYTDLRPLFNSTAIGDKILKADSIKFLIDVKNPCYALDKGYINVGNINISFAIQKGYDIFCLPYAFLSGFPKCGTNDLFFTLIKLRLIYGAVKDGSWRQKETHFFDNHRCLNTYTFYNYTSRYWNHRIVQSYKKYDYAPTESVNMEDDLRNMIFIDGTPRYVWHGDNWEVDEANKGLIAPKVLLPHKVRHIVPQAKIMLLVRNPADRLFSDYKFYYSGNQTAEDFHNKVVAAIGWWKTCTEVLKLPLKACAYGKAPADLPELSFANCEDKKLIVDLKETDPEAAKCFKQWDTCRNAANRLRVGMYDIYLKDWLGIYPKASFLIIKFEDYASDPAKVIDKVVLPFLNIPPLTEIEKRKFNSSKVSNSGQATIRMWHSTRNVLDVFYEKTKEALVDITGDQRFWWK